MGVAGKAISEIRATLSYSEITQGALRNAWVFKIRTALGSLGCCGSLEVISRVPTWSRTAQPCWQRARAGRGSISPAEMMRGLRGR